MSKQAGSSQGGEENATDFDISHVRGGVRSDNRNDSPDTCASFAKGKEADHPDHNMCDHSDRGNCACHAVCFGTYDGYRLIHRTKGCRIRLCHHLYMTDICIWRPSYIGDDIFLMRQPFLFIRGKQNNYILCACSRRPCVYSAQLYCVIYSPRYVPLEAFPLLPLR